MIFICKNKNEKIHLFLLTNRFCKLESVIFYVKYKNELLNLYFNKLFQLFLDMIKSLYLKKDKIYHFQINGFKQYLFLVFHEIKSLSKAPVFLKTNNTLL